MRLMERSDFTAEFTASLTACFEKGRTMYYMMASSPSRSDHEAHCSRLALREIYIKYYLLFSYYSTVYSECSSWNIWSIIHDLAARHPPTASENKAIER